MSIRAPRRKSLVELLGLVLVLGILAYLVIGGRTSPFLQAGEPIGAIRNLLPCSQLPGANDTVVILKTSVAEIEERLPIHLDTTIQCYPKALIFSDFRETYKGHAVVDVLESVSAEVRRTNPDFDLWRRVQKGGPDALEDEELWRPDETVKNLDKWKYLPMVNRTFSAYPDAKWYVFVETDTYIFWSTLLAWLKNIDHTQAHYIGSSRWFGDREYGHVGAGIILSHRAMEIVVEHYTNSKSGWEQYTAKSDHGDVVLGRVLAQTMTQLTSAWPMLQKQSPAELDYSMSSGAKRLWCSPTVSYHGMTPGDIAEFWKFEQQWIQDKPHKVIRHSDLFSSYLMPRLIVRSGRVDDWDNFSGNSTSGTPASSVDECRGICVDDSSCVQFSFADGQCKFSSVPKMGTFKRGVNSRWLLARAQRFADQMEACPEDGGLGSG